MNKPPFIRRIKGWKLPAVAAIGLLFALTTVFGKPAAETRSPLMMPPGSTYAESIAGIGVVEPKSELISIGVELPGVVRTVHVKVGDRVHEGDPLFSLDPREVDAEIKTLEAALTSAKVQADDSAAQFAIVSGLEDKRAVAKDDFNRRKFGKLLGLARVDEIKAQLEQAQITKERQTIKAPIDGQILEVNIHPGEYASAGALAAPLIRMGDVSTLYVRVEIDEEYAAHIDPKQPAYGLRRGDTQTKIPLNFVRFEPFVRPKQNLAVAGQRVDTRVLQVLYALPETQEGIFVGQQLDVFIDTSAAGAP